MQSIIEAALSCLLEQRLKYPIVKIGILEAYLPQRKIEVLTGTTTLATILIAGLEYLKYYGLPSTGEECLLGKCSFIKFNSEGILHNFSDLSKLDPKAQAEKLENYQLAIQGPVANFLTHFVRSETFYQRPEVSVKLGIPPTALQTTTMDCGVQIEGYQGAGWYIPDVLKKLQEQEYHDMAEVVMANFEQLKGPMEIRAQILKSWGLHVKDLLGSTAHLTSVNYISLRYPDKQDLENWIGWNPAVKYAMKDLKECGNDNREGIYKRLDRLEEMLLGLAEQISKIRISQEIKDRKANMRKSDD